MPTFDESFTAAMEAVVQERGPDWVYPLGEPGWVLADDLMSASGGCRYVRTDADEPGCIIGAALHKMGVPLHQLRPWEGQSVAAVIPEIEITLNIGHASENLMDAADWAQTRQDLGATWGEALEKFKEVLNGLPRRVLGDR